MTDDQFKLETEEDQDPARTLLDAAMDEADKVHHRTGNVVARTQALATASMAVSLYEIKELFRLAGGILEQWAHPVQTLGAEFSEPARKWCPVKHLKYGHCLLMPGSGHYLHLFQRPDDTLHYASEEQIRALDSEEKPDAS